jgi:hypothetical protein
VLEIIEKSNEMSKFTIELDWPSEFKKTKELGILFSCKPYILK